MSNIYICFADDQERREFLLDFLDLRNYLNGNVNGRHSKKQKEMDKKGVETLLELVDSKTFKNIHRRYYDGRIPENENSWAPWSTPGLFASGIRSLYTKKSYMHRPGCWLAINLRNTPAGRAKYEWIINNISQSQMGFNVPLPESYFLKEKLNYVKRVIGHAEPGPYVEKALDYLLDVKETEPKMFRNKNKYLFEEMARVFEALEMQDKAIFCFEKQAELLPGCSDPYLNMGVIYNADGDAEKAIATYMQGLQIDPEDEYIYYNLSALLMEKSMYDLAIRHVNSAILANPERGLNFSLKGDIHFGRDELFPAISSYEWALSLFDQSWQSIADDCRLKLAEAYHRSGDKARATRIRAAMPAYIERKTRDTHVGKLYYETGELHYEGQITGIYRNFTPCGWGTKYFKNGQVEMEGFFGDWFVEWGNEYYQNGSLRYSGYYNSGKRNYYGPRYFTEGKLYYESGELWYEGTYQVEQHGSMAHPIFKAPDSFYKGTEYSREGEIIKVYK